MRSGHSESVGVRKIIQQATPSLPEYVALFDRAAHGANLGRDHFGSPEARMAHNVLSALSAMDNSGLAIRASSVEFNGDATSATLKLCVKDDRATLEIDTVIGS
jgi:hypothetical protein